MKKIIWISLLMFLVLANGVLTGDEREIDRFQWFVGDAWTYKVTSQASKAFSSPEEKTIVQKRIVIKKNVGEYVVSWAKGKCKETYNSKLNALYWEENGQRVGTYHPEKPTFKWPLKAGKIWNDRYSVVFATPSFDEPPFIDVVIEAKGLEEINLEKFGRVRAFKMIERRYNPRGACVLEQTRWVAPEFRNIVKWVEERPLAGRSSTGELIEFSPGAAE